MRYAMYFVYIAAAVLIAVEYSSCATTGGRAAKPAISTQQTTKPQTKGKPVMHAAFVNAGQKPGLEIWRIENFEPVAYSQNDYGKFHTGDSYIVLFTKDNKGSYSWDIHFWLGRETSQDESGAAAALTVVLDDQLNGAATQYREVQEHESQKFLSHFKNGVRYLPGGVASGFTHVDNTAEKKLFQVKGKKNIRVKQVELSAASLNKGDCFILDNGNDIYVYVGAKSKRVERLKAISAANLIRDQDHGGRSKVQVIDEFSTQDEIDKFFEVLGSGSPDQVPDESVGGDDDAFERNEERVVSLYKVSDANGKMEVQKVAEKPLKQEMLNNEDCFILDTELADLYVWIGKQCNPKEKSEAMTKAQHFLTSKKYPSWTRVQRIVAGAEPSIFRQYFSTWRGSGELHTRLIRSAEDVLRAYHCKVLPSGKFIATEIHDVEQDDLDEDDVVIIMTASNIFVWNGKDASEEERELSMSNAESLRRNDENIVSVEQGDEPESFTDLFPEWNPEHWGAILSYADRKNVILDA